MKKMVAVYSVAFAAFLGPFSQSIYAPILSDVASYFNSPQLFVNASLSIYTFFLAIMQIVYGPLTDRFGPRKVLIPGVAIYIIASMGCYFSTSIYPFLIFRGIQASGIAVGTVASVAIIAELCEGKQLGRAMGTYQMLVSLGPVLGPVFGGIIWGSFGYSAIISLLIALGALALVLNAYFVKGNAVVKNAGGLKWSMIKNIVSNKIGISIISLGFIQYYTFFSFLVFYPMILMERYGLTTVEKGLVFLPLSGCIVLGSFIGGKLAGKIRTPRFLIMISFLNVLAILISVGSLYISFYLTIVCSSAFGLCLGMSLPVQTIMLSQEFLNERATSVGIYNFFRFLGIAVSPVIGGFLYEKGNVLLLFGVISLIFCIIVCMIRLNFKKVQNGQKEVKQMIV
ncbi:MFS transporter [Bacillus sp. 1P06AnD]|uniref:MFS transporter n=1 Tax=Bacillus sp. 1P06AnD TaxID=3132208 RepID=UPI0039A06B48